MPCKTPASLEKRPWCNTWRKRHCHWRNSQWSRHCSWRVKVSVLRQFDWWFACRVQPWERAEQQRAGTGFYRGAGLSPLWLARSTVQWVSPLRLARSFSKMQERVFPYKSHWNASLILSSSHTSSNNIVSVCFTCVSGKKLSFVLPLSRTCFLFLVSVF